MFWLDNPINVNSYYQFKLLQSLQIEKTVASYLLGILVALINANTCFLLNGQTVKIVSQVGGGGMLLHVVVTTLVALGVAPCVLQRVCPPRPPRPPAAVCMHRLHPEDNSATDDRKDEREHKRAHQYVLVQALLRLCLAAVLLFVPLHLSSDDMLTVLVLLLLQQVIGETKSFTPPGKAERAMFSAHSEACLAQSGASRAQVARLLAGAAADEPALRRHVYCVLRRCKLLRKDGRLDKQALRQRAGRPGDAAAAKMLESCPGLAGDGPEDRAWLLFRCGLHKKVLFAHMTDADNDA